LKENHSSSHQNASAKKTETLKDNKIWFFGGVGVGGEKNIFRGFSLFARGRGT
jgi:hypothetical protein